MGVEHIVNYSSTFLSGYVTSNDRMPDDELERMGKKEVVVWLLYYSGVCIDGLRKTTKDISNESGATAEFQT